MPMPPMKRVYYFTPPDHALDNLINKRLKVSRFSKCNDPFELASLSYKNKAIRTRFHKWLGQMDESHGLLCFCRSWRNPVMWAHYSKSHTGLCYGFDVDPRIFVDVRYVSERLYPDLTPENFFEHVGADQMIDLFATKFIHWSYEEEVRLLVNFSQVVCKDELVFHEFSDTMKLREVIIGPNSEIKAKDAREAVAEEGIKIFKSRLAFRRFEIVRQNDRSRW